MSHPIESIDDLQRYLQIAIQLEHSTIPPYLTALYSIKPSARTGVAFDLIRAVVVEEMLHMTLAANLLNAVGGKPKLTEAGFVPPYPTFLPSGESDFQVSLQPFSPGTIEMFKQIERPAKAPAPEEAPHCLHRVAAAPNLAFVDLKHARPKRKERAEKSMVPIFYAKRADGSTEELHYWSIGEFYAAILQGMEYLVHKLGEAAVFTGCADHQAGPEAYTSGGGKIIKVHDLASARTAINAITEQGEGSVGHVINGEGELSHYARFDQILQGRRYNIWKDADGHWQSDPFGEPRGEEFPVEWEEMYAFLPNAKVANYPEKSDVREAALAFNQHYHEFLVYLEAAFNGKPELLTTSYRFMFKLSNDITKLVRHPFPSDSRLFTAAPTFEC